MPRYDFRAMIAGDLPLLARWLATPEVARWWPDGDLDDFAEQLGDPHVAMTIVMLDGEPFAYVQDYDPHAWSDHPLKHLPAGSRGLDQFIGEPALIGRGHGPAFIDAHARRLFAAGAPALGVDPHPDNSRAIAAYARAGFSPERERDTPWGRALLMVRRAPAGRA